MLITSFSNPKIKDVIKLRESSYRRDSQCFLIDGLREIERAVLSGVQFLEFFVVESKIDIAQKFARRNNECQSYFKIHGAEKVIAASRSGCSRAKPIAHTGSGITINTVSELLIQKIGFGNRNDGIVAVAKMSSNSFDDFLTKSSIPLFVVLERIEKPGNIGAVFRCADGAGVSGIILADQLTDLYNPNAIRSSLGTLFSIPVVETTGLCARDWLIGKGIKIAAAKCGGEFSYTKYNFREPTAIVLGSEAEGLTETWNGENVTSITIPMTGIADSLNISTAAAILLYEAKRQRYRSR